MCWLNSSDGEFTFWIEVRYHHGRGIGLPESNVIVRKSPKQSGVGHLGRDCFKGEGREE